MALVLLHPPSLLLLPLLLFLTIMAGAAGQSLSVDMNNETIGSGSGDMGPFSSLSTMLTSSSNTTQASPPSESFSASTESSVYSPSLSTSSINFTTASPTSPPTPSPTSPPTPSPSIPPSSSSISSSASSSSPPALLPTSTSSRSSASTPAISSSSSPTSATVTTTSSREQELVIGVAILGFLFALFFVLSCLLALLLCFICCRHSPFKKRSTVRDLHYSYTGQSLLEMQLDQVSLASNSLAMPYIDPRDLFAHIPPGLKSVAADDLTRVVEVLHADEEAEAADEYEDVKNVDQDISSSVATQPYNENKNRYINILPDDATRVQLVTITKVPGSDYINANYIRGYSGLEEYIAAQGPLSTTVMDFWRMIWEHKVHLIVMVTNLMEGGIPKCQQYWPDADCVQYGSLAVTLEDEEFREHFSVRTFTISSTGRSKGMQVSRLRKVVQFHFTVWPDFGVPEDASSMIAFVRRVRAQVADGEGPMVVHCSAGVGRTGTFIAIDVMLQQMAAGKRLTVMEFVAQMRAQRNNMVQTTLQYLFIYDALLCAHRQAKQGVGMVDHNVSTFLPTLVEARREEEKEEEDGEMGVASVTEPTNIAEEFQGVMEDAKFSPNEFSIASSDNNAHKNRNTNDLPLDENRVIMGDVSGEIINSDYINASFVCGVGGAKEFIVTQHPLTDTRAEFWRMIIEKDVTTVVMIGSVSSEERYWPKEDTADYGPITVDVVDTTELQNGLTCRCMSVQWPEDEASVQINHYHLWAWPEEGTPPTSGALLTCVRASRRHWKEQDIGCIAVHSSSSVAHNVTGVYCALSVLLGSRTKVVDVATTCQLLRQQRPGILTSLDYYRFIYKALADAVC